MAKFKESLVIGHVKRYKLLEPPPTQGAQSLTWIAHEISSNERVVIKFAPDNPTDRQDDALRREAVRLMRIKPHPNIVSIIDNGDELILTERRSDTREVRRFLVYKYINNGDISGRLVGKSKSFPSFHDTVLRLAMDVGHALEHAHREGVFHFDVKPENILWAGDDEPFMLGDFGLARTLASIEAQRNDMMAWGTVGYRDNFENSIDPAKRDIFSLGATIYKIYTNATPQFSNSDSGLKPTGNLAHSHSARRVSCEADKTVPPDILEILDACLQAPENRPGSISEVVSRLDRVLRKRHGANQRPPAGRDPRLGESPYVELRALIAARVKQATTQICELPGLKPHMGRANSDWYATILLRPSRKWPDSNPEEVFYPIYFEHRRDAEIVSSADWTTDEGLKWKSYPIDGCCSGLCVNRDKSKWEEKQLWLGEFMEEHYDRISNRLHCLVFRNVEQLRFNLKLPNNLVRENYAADQPSNDWPRAIGWDYLQDDGSIVRMRRDIQIEIVVPLYDPQCSKESFGPDDVLGVVNIEWVAPFGPDHIKAIIAQLKKAIHDENKFQMTTFASQILRIATYGVS